MNLKEIKAIVGLMNENELVEVELEREGVKLRLKKAGQENMVPMARMMAPPAAAPVATAAAEAPKAATNVKAVTSPMVGTFYRAPSPESPPFVEVGQLVEVGQVVCIVEAMKLMNEIKSEIRGKISKAPVENAEPVEFGQTLFEIEPA